MRAVKHLQRQVSLLQHFFNCWRLLFFAVVIAIEVLILFLAALVAAANEVILLTVNEDWINVFHKCLSKLINIFSWNKPFLQCLL
jgi:hypothetical protein